MEYSQRSVQRSLRHCNLDSTDAMLMETSNANQEKDNDSWDFRHRVLVSAAIL